LDALKEATATEVTVVPDIVFYFFKIRRVFDVQILHRKRKENCIILTIGSGVTRNRIVKITVRDGTVQ
jgi:hypothetical protein